MKLLLLFLLTFMNIKLNAQDIILKKSGDEIKVKVTEVNIDNVKYKVFENIDGPSYTIAKSEIFMITYENGSKDVFNEITKTVVESSTNSSNEDLFIKGQTDASRYYKGYKGAGTGVLLTSLIASPLIGLIPAIACSSTQPNETNLNYPNSSLMKKPDYYNGYTQKSKKIKQGKVWSNWGIAFGVNFVAVLILTTAR